MSRFDYVRYDPISQAAQEKLKGLAQKMEMALEELQDQIPNGLDTDTPDATLDAIHRFHRAQENAIDSLEEAYMWCGKMIRDAQIARNGSAPLQEERGNE